MAVHRLVPLTPEQVERMMGHYASLRRTASGKVDKEEIPGFCQRWGLNIGQFHSLRRRLREREAEREKAAAASRVCGSDH